jgi:hypothetical protein
MAALMVAVVVAAARVVGMLMGRAMVSAAVTVSGHLSRIFVVLDAAERMRHCRHALDWDQQQ